MKIIICTSCILFTFLSSNVHASIIAEVIAGEASGEGRKGAYAVACVILNRMKVKGKTAEEIVTQKSQFSAYEWQTAKTRHKHYMKDAMYYDWLEEQITNGTLKDITDGATHFYNPRIYPNFKPCWLKVAEYRGSIGKHDFYYYMYF